MMSRSLCRIAAVALTSALLSYSYHLRRCHANVFAGKGKANWRTAFVGDSLIQFWRYPATNLGVFGQTTAQIRERFERDALCHCYKRIVLLAGTNDVGQRISAASSIANLDAMLAAANKAGVPVYIGTIPPLWNADERQMRSVDELNAGIRALAVKRHSVLLDFNDALMVGRPRTFDQVHLDEDGYQVLWQVLHSAGIA